MSPGGSIAPPGTKSCRQAEHKVTGTRSEFLLVDHKVMVSGPTLISNP